MATTKFEPNHARLAFPCFDEPAMKAVFNIEIIKPTEELTVLSNMPAISEEVYDKTKGNYLVRFQSSPLVSTYSLCWIISDFHVVQQDVTSSGTLIRALAKNGQQNALEYATAATKKSIEFFQQYLQVDYGLPKLDIIGVPDFSSGAMENWGIVTFKETNILINPDSSSYMDYFSVVNVVCHEIAHMWFGNLVTMKWWNDIWLNEGFATYLSMKCTKALQPELNPDELGYVKKKLSALVADTAVNTHPVVQTVTHNNQLSGVFDEISYRKGYSLLEMFEDMLGVHGFRTGLNIYLKRHEFDVSETSDLVSSLENATGRELSSLISGWTEQPGYPLVTVKKNGDRLILSQKRFIHKDKETDKRLAGYKWDIPIKYRTEEDAETTRSVLFGKENDTIIIKLKNESDWFKINMGGVGFYRVHYPEETWHRFQQFLQDASPVFGDWSDRANILDDACSLASAGHMSYDVPLSLFEYLTDSRELHYAPWRVASKCLNDIKKRLSASGKTNEMYSSHVRNLIDASLKKTLEEVNKNKSSPFDYNPANEVIFSLGCAFKHPDALDKAKQLFDDWLNGTDIDVDTKSVVFRYGLSGEDEEPKWEKLWNLYGKKDDAHELRDLRVALVSVKNTTLLQRLIKLSKNESAVRTQDYYAILTTMANKKKTNNIVWHLFKDEFRHLESKFSVGKISKLFQTVASNFYTKNKLREVKDFLSQHPDVVPQKEVQKKVEENIQNNMKWRERHEHGIGAWLLRKNNR